MIIQNTWHKNELQKLVDRTYFSIAQLQLYQTTKLKVMKYWFKATHKNVKKKTLI